MSASYRAERLVLQGRSKQDCSQFDCGVPELNDYFQKQVGQDERRRVAACYHLIEQKTKSIVGYYTLSAGSVQLNKLPQKITKKLPRYPTVPVVRIGRLAVALTYQNQGLGGVLLWDAINRTVKSDIAAAAIVVDAKSDLATAFYEHHGFTSFASEPQVLFLPMSEAIRRLSH